MLVLIKNTKNKTLRAADEIRTRDIQLGRLTLYQLSYHRNSVWVWVYECGCECVDKKKVQG